MWKIVNNFDILNFLGIIINNKVMKKLILSVVLVGILGMLSSCASMGGFKSHECQAQKSDNH